MQPQLERLEAEAENLLVYLRASEDWEPGYRDDPDSFEKLLRLEAKLQRGTRAYLRGLGDRVGKLVNWQEYSRLKADFGDPEVVVELVDPHWDAEGRYLLNETLDIFVAIETLGYAAAEYLYRTPLGIADSNARVVQSAREEAGKLIKQRLNPTTRKLIQQSIANSIAKGHNQKEALGSLRQVTTNLARADLIATTEVVNSFGRGNFLFAKDAGFDTKEWKVSLAPCKICSPIPRQGNIPIDQPFIGGNGKPYMHQGAHPRCKCRVLYHRAKN